MDISGRTLSHYRVVMKLGQGASGLVYLAEDAKLVMPFVNLGLVPEFAASRILPQRIGPINAARHLLLGEPMTAQEAVAMGLANTVLPASDVVAHARRVAERFNTLPPAAVRETKKLMRAAGTQTLRETIDMRAKALQLIR